MRLKDPDKAFDDFRHSIADYCSEMDFTTADRTALMRALDRFQQGDMDLDDDRLFELWDVLGMNVSRSDDLELLFEILETIKELRDACR